MMSMRSVLLLLLFLHYVPRVWMQQRCLFSRLEYLPCKYRSRGVLRAGENEYTVHHTRFSESSSGFIECRVRSSGQVRADIPTLGNDDVKFISSPGYLQGINYDNQLLAEYKVHCSPGELASINITYMDIEEGNCIDGDGISRCQDYLLIDSGPFGTTELCGNTTTALELQTGSFTVYFRTSEEGRRSGFEMYVVCFNPAFSCPALSNPINGRVTWTNLTVGGVATYLCDDAYELVGNMTRVCQGNDMWSEDEPVCRVIPKLEIGDITVTGNDVVVSVKLSGATAMILVTLIDAKRRRHSRVLFGSSGSVVFNNLPRGGHIVRADCTGPGGKRLRSAVVNV